MTMENLMEFTDNLNGNSQKKIIIIADDQFIDRAFLKKFFEGDYPKYDLEVYETGKAVEKRFINRGFNGVKLVVLDQVMDPGLRGSELIKKYSAKAKDSGCRMILYTGEGKELGEQAIRDGALSYISKPIAFNKLEEIIRAALS